jgi:DNA-binding NarL/FixJ family response regulator
MPQSISQTESASLRIMLADDSELLRGVIRKILLSRYPTCEISEAGSIQEALTKIVALKPHLVLLDISIADTEGFEIVAGIRQLAPMAKIIICSLREPKELAMIVQNVSADGYFAKSSSAHDLIGAIVSALNHNKPHS